MLIKLVFVSRSHTSLGIALTDTPSQQIRISSIQPGSLADRCGYLKPGDILTSLHISSNETIPCSPYYTSYQIAQILRKLASRNSSVTLTILPHHTHSLGHYGSFRRNRSPLEDDHSSSTSTITITEDQNCFKNKSNQCILSLCLWKDRLYEDWGFSLIDEQEEEHEQNTHEENEGQGGRVYQIRPGGPASIAGLRQGDKLLQVKYKTPIYLQ